MDSHLWDDLLLVIEEGEVVPIVGQALLTIKTETGPRLFRDILAEQLIEQLSVSPDTLPQKFCLMTLYVHIRTFTVIQHL